MDWKAALTATFHVGLLRAVCVSAKKSDHIYDESWRLTASQVGKSGNTAAASFTFECRSVGVTVKTMQADLTLACDRKGNVTSTPQANTLDLNVLQRFLLALQSFFRRFFGT